MAKEVVSAQQIARLDGAYKDVSGAWLELWKNAGRMLNIVESLSKPIIDSLMSDKRQYLATYNQEILGNAAELGYYGGTEKVYGVAEKLADINYCIRQNNDRKVKDDDAKSEAEAENEDEDYVILSAEKQQHPNLIELMGYAKDAHAAVQALSVRLAEAVHGHSEGDPGIKKPKRCVEKMCTRQIQRIEADVDATNEVEPDDWTLTYDVLKDVARAGVSLPDMHAIRDALFKLQQWQTGEYGEQRIIEITRVKNRFDPEYEGIFGYRDLLINLRFLNPEFLRKRQWRRIFEDWRACGSKLSAWVSEGAFEYELKRAKLVSALKEKGLAEGELEGKLSWKQFWALVCARMGIDSDGCRERYLYGAHICELQLHHEKIQHIRAHGNGHSNYSNSRFMIDFVLQMKSVQSAVGADPNKAKIFELIQKLSDCK